MLEILSYALNGNCALTATDRVITELLTLRQDIS